MSSMCRFYPQRASASTSADGQLPDATAASSADLWRLYRPGLRHALIGGWLADSWLGQRNTAMVGGILMAIGHFMMASRACYFALLLLIFGTAASSPTSPPRSAACTSPAISRDRPRLFRSSMSASIWAPSRPGHLRHLGRGRCGARFRRRRRRHADRHADLSLCAAHPARRPAQTARAANAARALDPQDWNAFAILWLLFIPGCLFWASYEQSGNTVECGPPITRPRGDPGPASASASGRHGSSPSTASSFCRSRRS